ncbi:histidine phosphatase family protein [archaeon]|jgi:2,3-bisphosphoglycerate-dependent phosphoglycerate mutase|nr:histidine phosphatase family protein [archaeon]MBT6762859.1 histidine phosphatase family protein [archaeon]
MTYLESRMAVLNRKHEWTKKHAARKTVKIFVFRHGHTSFNQLHKFCGWRDSKLTDLGKVDARKVAKKMHSKHVDVAFHSSLSRSVDTMEIALSGHSELKVKLCDDRLIERSYGELEGKTHTWFVKSEGKHDLVEYLHWHKTDFLNYNKTKELIDKFGKKDLMHIRRGYSVTPPGGESIKDVEKRVKSFISDLLNISKKYHVNVALSVHGNSMRPLRRYFEKLSVKEMMHLENPWDEVFVYTVKV